MTNERVPADVRRFVRARAEDLCEYCRIPGDFATQSFTVDHIHPRAAGGQTTLDNLAWACFGCNAHKHSVTEALDPDTGATVPLYHPRRDVWRDHFEWENHCLRIGGKTPTGRATVELLHFNRSGLVNLRQVLTQAGLFPPADNA